MRNAALLIVLVLLAACSRTPAPPVLSLGGHVDDSKDSVAIVSPTMQDEEDDRKVRETLVRMEAQTTHQIRTAPTTERAEAARPHTAVLDASNDQTFAHSLQAMMMELDPHEREALRYVFIAYNMALAKKVVALQHSGQIKQASDLSDDQVIQLAYGELNGKTFPQVLALGHELAKTE